MTIRPGSGEDEGAGACCCSLRWPPDSGVWRPESPLRAAALGAAPGCQPCRCLPPLWQASAAPEAVAAGRRDYSQTLASQIRARRFRRNSFRPEEGAAPVAAGANHGVFGQPHHGPGHVYGAAPGENLGRDDRKPPGKRDSLTFGWLPNWGPAVGPAAAATPAPSHRPSR